MKKFLHNLFFSALFTSTFNAPKMVAVPIIPLFYYSEIDYYSGDPKDPRFKTLFDTVRKHLENIKKATSRLKGKEQEESMKNLDDMWKQLEERAKSHGLPWEGRD
jgi:hypothetical protein